MEMQVPRTCRTYRTSRTCSLLFEDRSRSRLALRSDVRDRQLRVGDVVLPYQAGAHGALEAGIRGAFLGLQPEFMFLRVDDDAARVLQHRLEVLRLLTRQRLEQDTGHGHVAVLVIGQRRIGFDRMELAGGVGGFESIERPGALQLAPDVFDRTRSGVHIASAERLLAGRGLAGGHGQGDGRDETCDNTRSQTHGSSSRGAVSFSIYTLRAGSRRPWRRCESGQTRTV